MELVKRLIIAISQQLARRVHRIVAKSASILMWWAASHQCGCRIMVMSTNLESTVNLCRCRSRSACADAQMSWGWGCYSNGAAAAAVHVWWKEDNNDAHGDWWLGRGKGVKRQHPIISCRQTVSQTSQTDRQTEVGYPSKNVQVRD